jgi:PAS domain S-box-containing protein
MPDRMKTIRSETFNDKQLRAVLDNTVDGIVVINSLGIILSYNKACEKLFGYSPEEAIGENVRILTPSYHHAHHDGYIQNYLTTREAKIIGIGREVMGCRKDKTEFPMLLSIGEVIEDDKHFFVGIIRDITSQKNHEAELHKYMDLLERSNRELDDFVYIISHDLKEPVRGMHGYAQFMLEDYSDILGEDGQSKLKSILRMSVRMDDLIDKLLYFSRLDRIEMAFTDLDLNLVISEITDLIEPMLKEKNGYIIMDTHLPTIKCDQARAGEVFRNLITNAIKYNDATERTVHVGVINNYPGFEGETVFYVRDNGIGIPEKHYESVFKMFKRLHGRDAYGGGTGSGLAITKKIISQHKGKIWVESKTGEGTCFYFTLEKKQGDV